MKLPGKVKSDLNRKFQKVLKTPASFDFFVAIHDFIKVIELNPPLFNCVSCNTKINQELKIPKKYEYLKRIYQGLEDADNGSRIDLGHDRYAIILELNKIRNKDVSESNSFWKKRELFRKLTGEIYKRLDHDPV